MRVSTLVSAAALAAIVAGTSGAQSGAAPGTGATRWAAWVGCWAPVTRDDSVMVLIKDDAPVVCITPTADANVAQVTTVAGDSVLTSQPLDASGRTLPLDARGCAGSRRAQWSADERRVYLSSTATCDGIARTSAGILSMSPRGEWLDIQSVAAGGGQELRVVRYRSADVPARLPAEQRRALEGREVATSGARLAAGAPVAAAAVLESSRLQPADVVEAWLLERGQPFALDAQMLMELADAGVPGRVTDAMVAVSNPSQFLVAHVDPRSARGARAGDEESTGRRILVTMDPYSPWDWGYAGYGRYGYGYLGYDPFYGRYGYSRYGYGTPVVVVVNGSTVAQKMPGRLVKGRGYTTDGTTPDTGTGKPRESSTSTSSTSATKSTTSTSSSSGSTSSSTSSERTAHQRP